MDRYGWTSRQFEEENTEEDLLRLNLYLEKKGKIEELERKKEELKAKMKSGR